MANQAAQTQTPSTIDLGGDSTFIIVNDGESIYVKVLRGLLSLVSPYFKALLNGNFREGNADTTGEPCTIEEGNVEGILDLLAILHMRYDGSIPMSPRDILQLAIVADKYDCVKAISLTLDTLFPRCTAALHLWDARDVIVAAFILDHPKIFRNSTREILMSQAGTFADIAQTEIGQRVPVKAWRKLPRSLNLHELTKGSEARECPISSFPRVLQRDSRKVHW